MHFELLKMGRNSRVESGINAALTVALRRIALYEAEILHLVVQNAGNPGVKEGKMRLNRGFYTPKKHIYGCDGSSWVYARWHCDDITDTVGTFT